MGISSTLRLNADDLNSNFIKSIKTLFKGQDIEITTKIIDKDFENEKIEYKKSLEDALNGKAYELDDNFWHNIDKHIDK